MRLMEMYIDDTAQVSTLMPWILGLQRWTQHREPLVFTLRFLRTAALQAQVNPQVRGNCTARLLLDLMYVHMRADASTQAHMCTSASMGDPCISLHSGIPKVGVSADAVVHLHAAVGRRGGTASRAAERNPGVEVRAAAHVSVFFRVSSLLAFFQHCQKHAKRTQCGSADMCICVSTACLDGRPHATERHCCHGQPAEDPQLHFVCPLDT